MKGHALVIAFSALALWHAPAAEARPRSGGESLDALIERRADLIAYGARSSRIALLDDQIAEARYERSLDASRYQRLEQARFDSNLTVLIDRRADLIASGASYSRVVAMDERIAAARLQTAAFKSRNQGLDQAQLAAKLSSSGNTVGVRSTRTSPPYGNAYGYWKNGPGSRSSGNSGDSHGNSHGNSNKGKGHGRGHSK